MARGPDQRLAHPRFERLFDEHRRAVLGYALRRVADPADAADVVAETFLVAWRRLDAMPAGEAERPWLLGVARRVLANQRRGSVRRHELARRLAGELTVQLPAEQTSAERDVVHEALSRLSEQDREVILLSAWDGLTPTQIAGVVGLRAVTVRSRLLRARRRLRAHLATLDPSEDTPELALQPRTQHPPLMNIAKEHVR
jgi:RNA polymerase sigma factor (sigma-70 family)